VPEENFWTLWCKGRLTEADIPTIRLGATPAGLPTSTILPFFTGRMPFLPPNQQCQSTEGNSTEGMRSWNEIMVDIWPRGNGVAQINQVTLRLARLGLRWLTVRSTPYSTVTSYLGQLTTQPLNFSRTGTEYRPKCFDYLNSAMYCTSTCTLWTWYFATIVLCAAMIAKLRSHSLTSICCGFVMDSLYN